MSNEIARQRGARAGGENCRTGLRSKTPNASVTVNAGGTESSRGEDRHQMSERQQSASGRTSRRRFLGAAVGSVATGAIGGPLLLSRTARAAGGTGANDRIRVGAIGVGGRASLLLQQLPESAQIVGLCDCNLPRAEG